MANSIIIRFQPKGDKELLRSLRRLNQIQKQLEGQIKETGKASTLLGTKFQRLRKSGNALGNTFATIRSKLLLYSFAVTLATAAFAKLFKKSMEQEKAERKLATALG